MIFIDSNVFVIDLRYHRDPNRRANSEFLTLVRERGDGATTLVNVLEVAGVLSHNLNPRQLRELVFHFPQRYGIRVFPSIEVTSVLPAVSVSALLDLVDRKLSFGDALVLNQVERYASKESRFVTWDAAHFVEKSTLTMLTPRLFLRHPSG